MLASLLPGLRDLRTPLLTGYLYLLAIWLTFGRQRLVPDDPDHVFVERLRDLREFVGVSFTVAAISFVAYLLGSLLVVRSTSWIEEALHPEQLVKAANGRRGSFYERVLWRPYRWVAKQLSRTSNPARSRLGNWLDEVVEDLVRRGVTQDVVMADRTLPHSFVTIFDEFYRLILDNPSARPRRWRGRGHRLLDDTNVALDASAAAIKAAREQADAAVARIREVLPLEVGQWEDQELDRLREQARPEAEERALTASVKGHLLEREVEALVVRMQIERPALYDGYDRLQSESEMRLSIFAPLLWLVGTATFLLSPWAVLLVCVPLLLGYQGLRLQGQALERITQALASDAIQSPILQRLRHLAENQEGAPPGQGAESAEGAQSISAGPP